MPKHDQFDDFFDDDDDSPIVDTRADGRLYRVPLGRLAANLVNPREDFGTKDQLMDLGKSLARRQIQACPVVSRGAYLKLWPDHAKQIGDVDYVLVSGERRFRAATAVGLSSLDCVADDNVAVDRKTFMEAVVSENVDRQNFDPVEEAHAVKALVTEFGTNRAVAQHFERVDGWVTQRLALTYLAPEVQALVRKRDIPLEYARKLGKIARDDNMSAAEQVAWWTRTRDGLAEVKEGKRKAKETAKKAAKAKPPTATLQAPTASSEPSSEVGGPSATDPGSSPDSGGDQGASFTAVNPDRPQSPPTEPEDGQPDGHDQGTEGDQGIWESVNVDRLPLQKPEVVASTLQSLMSASNFAQMVKVAQTLI
ncbi:ParB/RepB/Spo0J family partition protein [Streptomyces lydicus]|uniref:ParB/RepB/Spo0J family partition protein n=1 Tax=Streptomyces lydicus TaxID=47763 RepID=UPI00379C7D7C